MSIEQKYLPEVSDPNKVYSQILRDDYNQFQELFGPLQRSLLAEVGSTELVDRAPEVAARQDRLSRGIRQRNLERYGGAGLSAAQLSEQERSLQRAGQLGLAGGINVARRNQRQRNQALLAELAGIGRGINQQALAGLGTAAAGASARRNAYKGVVQNYQNQMLGLGSTLLLASFGLGGI